MTFQNTGFGVEKEKNGLKIEKFMRIENFVW